MEFYSFWMSTFSSGTSSCRATAQVSQSRVKMGFTALFAAVKRGGCGWGETQCSSEEMIKYIVVPPYEEN